MVIFVPFGVPGDIVDIRIIKKRKGYMEGSSLKSSNPLHFVFHRAVPILEYVAAVNGKFYPISNSSNSNNNRSTITLSI